MLKKLAKQILGPFYYQNPSIVWDFREWIELGGDGKIIKDYQLSNWKEVKYSPSSILPDEESLCFEEAVPPFPRYLGFTRNASIAGDGFVFFSDGCFLLQPVWFADLLKKNPIYFKRLSGLKRVKKAGAYFSSLLFWCGGFYHWVAQVLPRFHRVIDDLPADVHIIVPQTMEEWKWESLKAIGIPKNQCVPFQTNEIWDLEEFWYAPPVALSGDHERESLVWLRSRFVADQNTNENASKSKIYITRGEHSSRRVLNEDEIRPILEEFGFRIVDTGALPLDEQISIFKNASHIISPHGAGSTNMLWAAEGSKFLEIFHPNTLDRRCYWTMSQTLGHSYSYFVGKKINGLVASPDSEYLIETERFKDALEIFSRQ
jgi:hypothetical protein